MTFEQRKEPKQEIDKLEKEIADGNSRVDVLRQVCKCAGDFLALATAHPSCMA